MDKPKLMPADVFVEKTHGLFGLGVEVFAAQHYQHVKAVRADCLTVIEDGLHGVAVSQLDVDWSNFEVWRVKDVGAVTRVQVVQKLETRLGEWYSVPELIAEDLRKRYRIMVPNMPGADCSEFLAWAWQEVGNPLFDVPPYQVAPWDFRNPLKLERIY